MQLLNVSNRLPVTVAETITPSAGGLVSAMEGFRKEYEFKWIGWSGGTIAGAARRAQIEEELQRRFNYFPIFLSNEDVHLFYSGFSNSSLWPLLHYLTTYAQYDPRWFDSYVKVNRIFAQKVADCAQAGDMVWIHDYHLMLLPRMIRDLRPELKTGFFLHTPFPSYEIFRCHPNRRQLLEGLLGADLIGFHTSSYLRHFRSTVLRILGINSEFNIIATESHQVRIGVYPISIPADRFIEEMKSPAYQKRLKEYRRIYAGRKVVLNVERLDYTKGVPRRLDAIEHFLERTGRQDVVFIFINVPSREGVPAYQSLRRTIEIKVSKINGEYATIENVPIHFIHRSINFSQLCALYTLADVAMVTPLVDGMNLVAKEYLMCQQESSGVLILSEFAGAAQELPQAVIVNPYNVDEMSRALQDALNASEEEKLKRLAPMRRRIMRYDAQRWAHSFIGDLAAINENARISTKARSIDAELLRPLLSKGRWALFMDYDGTLIDLRKDPSDASPDERLSALFSHLRHLKHLEVYLISGRTRGEMEAWFGPYGFSLIAEHGFYYRHRNASKWVQFEAQVDLGWKDRVSDILLHYADTTPGTFVEAKTASVVWHYRRADPEFGAWKANQLIVELREMLSNQPVEIHHGAKIVEISSILINKGVIMQHLKSLNRYEHVLCAGDDETDEAMFRHAGAGDISIKVGAGHTTARYRAPSPGDLRELLAEALRIEDFVS